VNELLDDLNFARTEKPSREYFLGSLSQARKADQLRARDVDENDLLDGQQR
jgi:hypothetical protein